MNNGQFEFRFPGIREPPQLVAGTGVPGAQVTFEPGGGGQSQTFTIPVWAGPHSSESIGRQIKAYLRAQARSAKMHGLTRDAAKRLMHKLCVREEKRLAREASNNTNGTRVVRKSVHRAAQKDADNRGPRKRSLLSREAWNASLIGDASGSGESVAKRARETTEESDDCRDPGEENGQPRKQARHMEDNTQVFSASEDAPETEEVSAFVDNECPIASYQRL
ncbi:hypothetical protein AB1N83_014359 [Pleurotus pulmonarius]|nr:hypothetical protein EYR36_009964 [Pleurotus pulmonarius]KAF4593442.1 hypothetical protein EYR38_009156 [Pleurotus pulmonarius]